MTFKQHVKTVSLQSIQNPSATVISFTYGNFIHNNQDIVAD